MRQTAGRGCRVSAHTYPSPVATENGAAGRPIRATIAPAFSGGVDDLLVEREVPVEVLVEFRGSADLVVEQPDAATATPTAMAAATRNQVGAPTRSTRMPPIVPVRRIGSSYLDDEAAEVSRPSLLARPAGTTWMEPILPAACRGGRTQEHRRVEVMRRRWWRLLAVPAATALIVVGCAVGAGRDPSTNSTAAVVVPPVTTAATARAGGPLVGVVASDTMATELARLDPKTLRPLLGDRLKLTGFWPLLAVAPDRSRAVLGSEAGDLTVIDLVHLRQLGALQTNLPGAAILGWSWVGRSRLLLIDTSQQAATQVLAVDVNARRLVRRQRFNGVVQGYARLPHGLALLVTPANEIGRARLVVSDANAGLRTVTLAQINAGFKQFDDTDGSGPRMEQALPGIAADPAGRRVYVVPGNGPVAKVELASLAVTYHRLGRSASLLQRLARWWAPPAEAKIISGPSRNALWLGDGQLAVTGYDGSAKGHHREIPSGLQLINTADWTVRQVDRHSSSALLAGGRLLAFGTAFGTGPDGANQGYGLTLYGPGDRQPVHWFGAKQVSWIQVNGHLAYVQLIDANLSDVEGYAVIDLRSRRLLHQGTGTVPELLVPNRM
jgi:hypothetical protein